MTAVPCRGAAAPLLLAGLALGVPAGRADEDLPPAPDGKTWTLVWNDEFDGERIDEDKWEFPPEEVRRDGWWMRKAVRLDGKGRLVLSALKDGERYVTGCVRTRGKFERAFGYYVVRVQLQRQPGHWTAFWLFNDSVSRIGDDGRDGTEIDIFEKPRLDDRVHHALHWDGYGKELRSETHTHPVPGLMKDFHTFALWWQPDEYVFFVDGRETWRTKAGGVCRVPLYLMLSDEVGPWAGDIRKAALPDEFRVDYVRVYDLADRKKPPGTLEAGTDR